MRCRAALAALLLAVAVANLDFASAGVRTAQLDYPGTTGAFPAACDAGEAENADGAPSPDIPLGDPRVAKQVGLNAPEQIHLTSADGGTSMYISWTTGNASYTYCGDGSKNGNATADCFFNDPVAQKTGSEVRYSTQSNLKNYKTASTGGTYPTEEQYTQTYGVPNAGNNYTSPIIHHIKVTGLTPGTKYYYKVGNGSKFSAVNSFKTLPAPGTAGKMRIGVLADVGTTEATAEVLQGLEANKPDVVFLAGDHSYADNHGNDQRYWDAWFRLLENSTANTPWQIAIGNHEEETQLNSCLVNALAANGSCGTAAQIRANCPGTNCTCQNPKDNGEKGGFPPEFVHNECPNESAFVSALARWTTPYQEAGSPSPHFYSFETGLVHVIVLSPYEPYCGGSLPCKLFQPTLNVLPSGNSAQYEWLARDITKINRKKTPWVIAFFHNPWYTTFSGFKTDDCTRQALEPLLKSANVDLVFNGHIHAYERSNPVYNFQTSPTNKGCDPVHFVVGDAGNDETLTCGLIDEGLTNGKLDCTGQQVAKGSGEGYYFSCTSHTFQDSPYVCQKNDVRVNTTAIPASYYGCQEDGYCPNKQPIWSAFRSAAYGSGLLEIEDANTATWHWMGSFKNKPNKNKETTTSESITFSRCSGMLE